ncbi:putative alcohol dehydrogenase domain protein [Mycobacterium kansasii]|uniref:Putative alcohol dehydrogenase domain protein n=1 Tax=Mycobacterium kansasii TaxID=1768 RepID=A0A1V3WC03_MYCKA|nr:putative alcohol dehydrogenase domain protein [Mycobacterium kansasii]
MPEKLSAAKKLGVHDAYTPQRATDAGVKADVVVEAVGHPGALETAIALTARAAEPLPSGCRPRTRGSASRRWVLSPKAGR